MQPVSYGVPMYPNCFDQLTTHGIVAEDVVGYITGTPSPYLQNYVAQRGWAPSMPGQIMPDPLPTLQPPNPLPKGDVYQKQSTQNTVPTNQQINNFVNPQKNDNWKKIALALLLTGVTCFGAYKFSSALKALFKKAPITPPPTSTSPTKPSFVNTIASGIKAAGIKIKDGVIAVAKGVKNLAIKFANFCQSQWSNLTSSSPKP